MNICQVVPKVTGTYADTLHAIGLASLLEEIGYKGAMIKDGGAQFTVSATGDLTSDNWPQITPGYRYVWEKSKEKEPPPALDCLDYEEGRQQRAAWIEHRKRNLPENSGVEPPPAPSPEIFPAIILNSMRKGWNSDRNLAKWIASNPDATRAWVSENIAGGRGADSVPDITSTQILNPIAGKGRHSPKTELRAPNSPPDVLINGFAEWMKMRGFWRATLPYRSDEDFKFFVIEPADASLDGIVKLRRDLQTLNLWGGVRLDINAVLKCTRLLIDNSEIVQNAPDPYFYIGQLTPRSVITGLRQAYFKSLGTAPALMNDALLPLPDWFAINSADDADLYRRIIEEAIGTDDGKGGCLSCLDEIKSDEGRTLQQFRTWLLTGDVFELLEFHGQFAAHLLCRAAARKWAPAFSTQLLTALLTKSFQREYPMKEIVEDDGFKSIARAVRNCTIVAAVQPEPRRWQPYFGLAQQWKQTIKDGDSAFAAEVSDFIQKQNWESVYKLKGKRHVVSAADLDSFVKLVDAHGAELVGSLLLAYGYAWAPKAEETKQEDTDLS